MIIKDTYNEIKECFYNGKFRMDLWEVYADNLSPEYKEKMKQDSHNYNLQTEILPVMSYLISNPSKLELAHSSFLHLTSNLLEKVENQMKVSLDVMIVFCLGLCNGAGWATTLDGKDAVLLGVEKIVELSWFNEKEMAGLIYHEVGHILHKKMRKKIFEPKTKKDKSLWQIYSEGVAIHFEQLIYGDMNFYHQDKNGWKNWCEQRKTQLFKEFLNRIRNDVSVDQFFGDWCNFDGVSDIGYFLGAEMIKYFSKDKEINEIANLEINDVERAIEKLS